ncbi:MAG: PDZ domain-containing protein [Phycisphaerales bacterium]|nr:PDZ domain-containing protein [Phycisphaerales bacterium]
MNRSSPLVRLNTAAMTAALLAAAAGAPVYAQPSTDTTEKQLEGSFDQPLAGDDGGSQSTTVMEVRDDSGSYKLEMSGKKIKAWHDGKAVPKDRIRRTKDKVELLDKEGNVLHAFKVGGQGAPGAIEIPGAGRFFFREGVPGQPGTPQPPEPPRPLGNIVIQNAPPVMLGITMSDADEGVLEEINQGREGDKIESGIVVDRVVDELPAAKAGLEEGDVIIAVGGERGVDQEELRDMLRERKPGDELALKVFRDGKSKDITVKLEKFDAARLSPGMAGQPGDQVEVEGVPNWLQHLGGEQGRAHMEAARKELEKALKQLKDNPDLQPDKIRSETQKALEQALKAFREAEKNGQQQWERFMGPGEDGQAWVWSGKPDQFYKVPTPAPRGDGDTSRKLDRLADQLERLNRRLDELERRLDQR